MAPHLMGNQTHELQCVRVIGLGCQQLPITSLGLGQSAGLMMRDARRKELRDRRRRGCGIAQALLRGGAALMTIHASSWVLTADRGQSLRVGAPTIRPTARRLLNKLLTHNAAITRPQPNDPTGWGFYLRLKQSNVIYH
jgi:hypothetical protein